MRRIAVLILAACVVGGVATAALAKPKFRVRHSVSHHHGEGRSNVCSRLTTSPPQVGAQVMEQLFLDDKPIATKRGRTRSDGSFAMPFLITSYGEYDLKGTVTTKTNGVVVFSTHYTVGADDGAPYSWCPPPPP